MVSKILFSSDKSNWVTPQWLFDELDLEFDFDLDAAANEENAKVSSYIIEEDNALEVSWYDREEGITKIWVNPPYGRGITDWVRKGYVESQRGATVVMLLPARTDTNWFHDFILGRAEIRFIRGRLRFSECNNSAPFPSMIVIWKPPWKRGI